MRRRTPGLFGLLALAACTPADQQAADRAAVVTDSPAAASAPAAPASMSLASVAGRWDMRSVPDSGDTTATVYTMSATADSTGWTLTFPGRAPLPLRLVAVAGDSLVSEVGPYASVRRNGMQVVTRSTLRLQGDRLIGRSVARYRTTGPDSVLELRTEGTRRP